MSIRLADRQSWQLRSYRLPVLRGARRGAVQDTVLPALIAAQLPAGASLEDYAQITPGPALRGAAPPELLELEADVEATQGAVLIVRHASGAVSFHAPVLREARRGARSAATVAHFRVPLAPLQPQLQQRGLLSRVLKVAVLKLRQALIDKVVAIGIRQAGRLAEKAWWHGGALGWNEIRTAAGALELKPLQQLPRAQGRSLLFLHGTFSNTQGSFGKLLGEGYLAQLRKRYDNRVYAFEHYTVSRSLEENAQALLAALPEGQHEFDVVSYSRGGLLLRTLAEQPERFGAQGARFVLHHGVLLATPNAGTPLATPERWEDTFGMVANLLELFPGDNPWVMGASFVADGLVWLASKLSGSLDGLSDMDGAGSTISALQAGSGPRSGAYSAVGANYNPNAALWQKLLDIGVDSFFGGANDLVVPTDGAWRVDPTVSPAPVVPAPRVACFGFDGNLRPQNTDVHHLSVCAQPEVRGFIDRAFAGENQGLPLLDLTQPRRSRKLFRGAPLAEPLPAPVAAAPAAAPARALVAAAAPLPAPAGLLVPAAHDDHSLHLVISQSVGDRDNAQLLAMYRGAVIIEPFPLRNPGRGRTSRAERAVRKTVASLLPGERFSEIIRRHEAIRKHLDTGAGELPGDEELRIFGALLFEALFVGRVRRLYDVARSEQLNATLNVIFTCTIPWVASKPWEFVYDPVREKFLATEDVHFIRNVPTSVPAQLMPGHAAPLRMLVVAAQPVGTALLSLDDEEARIRLRFAPLLAAGLVQLEVLAAATVDLLQDRIVDAQRQNQSFDIVHFMGHGEFDSQADQGRLIFSGLDGEPEFVDTQTLREIFCGRGIKLVFLNACESGQDSRSRSNRGIAQSLVKGGLPAVVANQYKVLDPSAVSFAQRFYAELAHGGTLGEAAREARIAVNYASDSETIDWAVPMLYARDPNLRLCALSPQQRAPRARPLLETGPEAGVALRGAADARQEVGVADLAGYFPELSATLTALNECQSVFLFRPVKIAVPLGVWKWEAQRKRSSLRARDFAEAMRERVQRLHLDFLSCITPRWIWDEHAEDLYAWWSGDPALPVTVFSIAGLALPPRGQSAARVIANALVQTLAAQMLRAERPRLNAASPYPVHTATRGSCPFNRDAQHKLEHLLSPQRFDAQCEKELRRKLTHGEVIFAAFTQMLEAFDGASPDAAAPARKARVRKRARRR
ncbi:CHAT domain-containing protein [Solimonas aquatica]|uniref:CHAT domain-containing protein n=1 Tax=Solimonas aquatica TaxID=489703 RepID=A0A1H9DSS4_9GAMM|nr:CHAT domain-containing protein [Solimonas aquatica]SEQ16501.1 CHAT domain-containing protein [Solimonas aquatica]